MFSVLSGIIYNKVIIYYEELAGDYGDENLFMKIHTDFLETIIEL